MRINYVKVEQPIGTFFLCSISATILKKIAVVKRRNEFTDAVQRDQSQKRVKEIAKYCSDPDATFPTPIIIAVEPDADFEIRDGYIEINENTVIGEVIDGQHRLDGIKKSSHIEKFELPVVFMLNLYAEQKAYVFSIINSKQTRVSMSLIYDLFALSSSRSPFKTCHEIARALNREIDSPYYNRLKMLGKKEAGQELASLSQGTFIKYTLELISRDPEEDMRRLKNSKNLEPDSKCSLREYFIKEKDSTIYKIILNLLNGVSSSFEEEWNNPDRYIISKSIGYGAIIKAFPEIYNLGIEKNTLNKEFFREVFSDFKTFLTTKNIELTSDYFGSNEQARKKLADLIIESLTANRVDGREH